MGSKMHCLKHLGKAMLTHLQMETRMHLVTKKQSHLQMVTKMQSHWHLEISLHLAREKQKG